MKHRAASALAFKTLFQNACPPSKLSHTKVNIVRKCSKDTAKNAMKAGMIHDTTRGDSASRACENALRAKEFLMCTSSLLLLWLSNEYYEAGAMRKNSTLPDWALDIFNLRRRLGLSQSSFGSILHYSAMAVSRWETGKLEPSARCHIQLGNLAGNPKSWSFWTRAGLKRSDLGRMSPNDPPVMQRRAWPDFEIVRAGSGAKIKKRKGATKAMLVAVPLLEVHAGTIGQGGSQFTDFASATAEEMIAAPASWCPNPAQTNCMRAIGTSMSPLINDGDVIAVDGSQTDPKKLNGKIVVGWHRERGLSLARLIVADGVQLLESENREYMPVPVERDRKWQIVGKVLWWIRLGP